MSGRALLLATAVAFAGIARRAYAVEQTTDGLMLGIRPATGDLPGAPEIEFLSWSPRSWLYHNFLTDEECDHIVKLARDGGSQRSSAQPALEPSAVVNNNDGSSFESDIRSSKGMFLNRGQDDIVRSIEERIAAFSMVPVDHGEGIQVLKYEHGQKYEAHFDYFLDSVNTQLGGQRIATVLLYLSDVEEGGETVFPNGDAKLSPKKEGLTDCGKNGLAVMPRKGDALLFWSMHLDGTVDDKSLHAGCPVVRGTKWTATKWMHQGQYPADPAAPVAR